MLVEDNFLFMGNPGEYGKFTDFPSDAGAFGPKFDR